MAGLKYRDQFWGEKHLGYQTLYDRFKSGDEAVYELELLLKEHTAMQEDQLRSLGKSLGKVTNFASSCTTQMVEAWSLTKGTLELLQEIQTASLRGFQEQQRELARYRAELAASKRRVKEGECVEAVGLMQTTTTCLQKAKETYTARCAELEKLRGETAASAKEINKAEHKLARARDEYRAYVDKYEMVRAEFEERMEKSADAFEAHDRAHLTTIKAQFLAFAACQQEQSAAMLQVHSQYRESLGAISVAALMDSFCSECSTGTERPAHEVFESLEGGGAAAASQLDARSISATSAAAAPHSDSHSMDSSGGGGGGQVMQVMDLLTMDDPLPAPVKEEEEGERGEEAVEEEEEKGGGVRDKKDEKETPLSGSMSASFSASLGGSRQKLAMWLPGKRKKTSSICSTDVAAVAAEGGGAATAAEGVASSSGGGGFLHKFGRSRRSNKSRTDIPAAVAAGGGGDGVAGGSVLDDTYSTASSSRSEDKTSCLLTAAHPPLAPTVDEEGFTIREREEDAAPEHEEAKWASCSSDDEDDEDEVEDEEVQQQLQPGAEPKLRPKGARKKYSRLKTAIQRRQEGEAEPGCSSQPQLQQATESQDAALAALLQRLRRLQDRAWAGNATRAAAHRRLLLGLSQAAREAERLVIVVVAADLQPAVREDRKWSRMEQVCEEKGVRIVTSRRTRRELASLLGVRNAVGVVGVRNREGAEEEWARLERALQGAEPAEKGSGAGE